MTGGLGSGAPDPPARPARADANIVDHDHQMVDRCEAEPIMDSGWQKGGSRSGIGISDAEHERGHEGETGRRCRGCWGGGWTLNRRRPHAVYVALVWWTNARRRSRPVPAAPADIATLRTAPGASSRRSTAADAAALKIWPTASAPIPPAGALARPRPQAPQHHPADRRRFRDARVHPRPSRRPLRAAV